MIKNYLEIGQIVSTHGIRGEVRINPWCNGPEFVKKFKTLYKDANGKDFFKVVSCRPHKNVAIAKLEGIDTMNDAETYKQKYLKVLRADEPTLEEDEYYLVDIIGSTVYDSEGKDLGKIAEVIQTINNDVYWIKKPKELLVLMFLVEFM